MASLTNQKIKDSYEQILHVDADGGGNSTTHVSVKDGDNGTTFGFTIASDALMMTSTNRLELGDTGTYINQSGDGILNITSDNKIELNGAVVANEGSADVDFRIESNDETHMFFVDGGNNRVSIGNSSDAPGGILEITSQASAGAFNVPLLQLNNNDTDARVIDINAANIDNQVVDITADSVTTARVINVSADALTTGEILFLDDNSASTSTRNCLTIRQDNDAALNATALFVQSDAGGTGVKIDKNYPGTLVAADTITGLHIDFDHTVPNSGTATQTDIGIDLDVNSATLGTSTTYGMDIDVVGATSGTHTVVGVAVDVGSADTNYAALFNGGNVGIGTSTPDYLLDVEHPSGTAVARIHAAGSSQSAQLLLQNSAQIWNINCQTSGMFAIYDDTDNVERLVITTEGKVGIGTNTPTVNLELAKTDDEPTFKLTRMDDSISSGDSLGKIQWSSQDDDGTSDEDIAGQIQVLATETHDGGNFGTKMLFYTSDNTSSVLDPRMVIHNNGNCAIGTANANVVGYGTNARVLTVSDHGSSGDYGVVEIAGKRTGADGVIGELTFANLAADSSLEGSAHIRGYRDGDNDAIGLKFLTEANGGATTIRMTLDSAGKLIFPASTANDKGTTTVTDTGIHRYSEGHHIYTVTGSTSGSMTPRNDSGAMYTEYLWTRVGRICFISGKIEVDTDNSLSGTVKISIPFTSANVGASTNSGSKFPSHGMIPFQLEAGGTAFTDSQGVWGEILPNTDYMFLYYMHENGTKTAVTDANVDTAFSMWFSGNYVTDGN